MRVQVRFLVLLIGLVCWPVASHAEKAKTNDNAKVYNRKGEQGKVVVKVKEGQTLTVIGKEGRWLKVRVSGRTGYIPRSKVDLPEGDDEEISRNTRRRPFVDGRGTKRGFGGEEAPDDRIGADAAEPSGGDDSAGDDDGDGGKGKGKSEGKGKGGDDDDSGDASNDDGAEPSSGKSSDDDAEPKDDSEPVDDRMRARVHSKTVVYNEASKDSGEAFKAKPSDVLFVDSRKGKWTEVSVEEGDIGFIETSKLEFDDDGGGGGGGSHATMVDASARLGFMLVSQNLVSSGGTTKWPDKYKVGSSSVALALGGSVLRPYKKRYLVGGELTYDLAKAIPGIAFDPDGAAGPMPSSTTGFTIHNINLRAVGGYDLHKHNGMVVFAHLGYHYEAFLIADVKDLAKNTARLPSEVISGPMLGAALAIPKMTDKIGLRFSLDAILVAGSVTQTKNLEDGASPSVKRITFGGGMTYRWKPQMDLQVTYDLNYASLSFGAPVATSMRGHTGTSASRTDLNHLIAFGIAKAF